MTNAVKEIRADLTQKVLMKALEGTARTYNKMTGEQLTQQQREFLLAVVMGLTDAMVTAVRTGKMKPMDVAQLAVHNALAVTGLQKEGSNSAKYMDCGIALVALALTSVEVYGMLVTTMAAAGAAAPVSGGASLGVEGGVVFVSVLFWQYTVLSTTMQCAEDFQTLERAVPAHFAVASKRQSYTNMSNACY